MSKTYALTAVLAGGNLRYNLGSDIAGGGKAVRLFNKRAADNRTVLEHILKVYKVAVVHMLCKIICVVEMDNALLVSVNNILSPLQSQPLLTLLLRYRRSSQNLRNKRLH